MIQIKPNTWYKVNCQAARTQFIELCKHEHKDCKIHPDSWEKATCLRYNSRTNTVNYRRNYDERYMGKITEYTFQNCIIVDDITEPCKIKNCTRRMEEYLKEYCKNQMKMEENEMIPGTFVNDEMSKYDPIVSKYYGKKLEELTKDFQKRRDAVISQSALGKAASNYISIMEKIKPNCYHESIENMVSPEFLTKEEQNKISEIYIKEGEAREKIYNEQEQVMFLLSHCTTLEQRERIYTRYGILSI